VNIYLSRILTPSLLKIAQFLVRRERSAKMSVSAQYCAPQMSEPVDASRDGIARQTRRPILSLEAIQGTCSCAVAGDLHPPESATPVPTRS
jgi:hypothetical protein